MHVQRQWGRPHKRSCLLVPSALAFVSYMGLFSSNSYHNFLQNDLFAHSFFCSKDWPSNHRRKDWSREILTSIANLGAGRSHRNENKTPISWRRQHLLPSRNLCHCHKQCKALNRDPTFCLDAAQVRRDIAMEEIGIARILDWRILFLFYGHGPNRAPSSSKAW